MCANTQGLGHGTDQIDVGEFHIGSYRTCSKDEHERDDRRSDQNRERDVSSGSSCFTGENRDVLESAESAEGHFAKDVEAKKRSRWDDPFDRVIVGKFPHGPSKERERNQGTIGNEEQDGADVMDPFSQTESPNSNKNEQGKQSTVERRNKHSIARQPRCARADGIRELGGNHESSPRHDQNAEEPKIPGHDETDKIVEPELGPLIQASF